MHQLVRKLLLWIAVAIVLIIAAGAIFIKLLSAKVDDLDKKTREYQAVQQLLVAQNSKLLESKKRLEEKIAHKGDELELMNEQLTQIEKIIGLKPDIGDAFDARLEKARRKSVEDLQKARLTVAELSLLNRSIPTGMPLKHYDRISDKFGYRMHPVLHERRFHFGTDFAAAVGTPVYAPADGVVEYAKRKKGYGNFLLINHPFGFKTAYGHLSRFAVREGDYVRKGDLIAYVGNTGRSTGPHLHYEVRYLYRWLDPMHFVKWSHRNYKKIMLQESLIHWSALLNLLQTRYRLTQSE
ncbi:MAG TPA: hypothetical protein ENK93_03170 [Campylobacteraceae bacterium]|nr:hypothetical protein [Campylobacteraceae bacterium]